MQKGPIARRSGLKTISQCEQSLIGQAVADAEADVVTIKLQAV
jgi:hypothetical protein